MAAMLLEYETRSSGSPRRGVEMLQSETFMRAVQADRNRDLERAAREHRLLTANAEAARDAAFEMATKTVENAARAVRTPCGDSAGLPA
jgi:hypothetical protein